MTTQSHQRLFVRAAAAIRRRLALEREAQQVLLEPPAGSWNQLLRLVRGIQHSRRRRWPGAARRTAQSLLHEIDTLRRRLAELAIPVRALAAPKPLPRLLDVYADLLAWTKSSSRSRSILRNTPLR